MTLKNRKLYDKLRYKKDKFPDKSCLRCGHNTKESLRVVGKTKETEAKVVLCLNCLEELKD